MYSRKPTKKQASPPKLPSPPKSCLKYRDVSSVIDTGPNARKRQAALEAVRQYYHVRPDELFRRIRPSTLVTLLVEVARLRLDATPAPHQQQQQAQVQLQTSVDTAGMKKRPSDLQSLVEGCGELSLSSGDAPLRTPALTPASAVDDQPYLLLDVRDDADFKRGHIATARHYPASRLARTMNYETSEMWRYKRHAHAVIVLIDEDEALAQRCATTLVQRGYDNVFILSGGLKMARDQFPRGLLSAGDKQEFTREELDALSTTLEAYSTHTDAPSGAIAMSSRSARSVCSQRSGGAKARAGQGTHHTTQSHPPDTRPGWKI